MNAITSHSSRLKPFSRALFRSFLISPVFLVLGCTGMTYNKLLDHAQAENREYVDRHRATCAIAVPYAGIRTYSGYAEAGFWDSAYRGGWYGCYQPGSATQRHRDLERDCEGHFGQECIVAFVRPYGIETYYFQGAEIEKRNTERQRQAQIAAQQQAAVRERDTLTRRQAQCRQYGFQPNSNALAQCVMQLAIAEEAQAASAAESARLQAAIREQAEEARRRQGFAQSMQTMQMGMDIASGIMPASPPITAPNSATGGMYKTCTYRVGNQLLPITVGRVELCPVTTNFNGTIGFLVR